MTQDNRAVLFDLYGTLVDVHVDEKSAPVWDAIAAEVFVGRTDVSGAQLEESYIELCDLRRRQKQEGFLLDSVFAQLLARFCAPSEPDAVREFAWIFRRHSIVYLMKKPYADLLLRRIREAGYLLGLISNTEDLVTRYDLNQLQLEPAFDNIILSSNIGIKKPDRKIFGEMLASLGVSAKAAAYVGNDFDTDVLGALNAGMDAVYLTAEPRRVRDVLQSRYEGRVVCADFSLEAISEALTTLHFQLTGPQR